MPNNVVIKTAKLPFPMKISWPRLMPFVTRSLNLVSKMVLGLKHRTTIVDGVRLGTLLGDSDGVTLKTLLGDRWC